MFYVLPFVHLFGNSNLCLPIVFDFPRSLWYVIVALAVPVLLVQILDRFRPGPYGWAGYLPNYLISTAGVRNAELVNIFGVYLNNFQFGPLLYLAITMLLLALCWLGWRRSAVGRI